MSLRRILHLIVAIVIGTLVWASTSPAGAVDNPDYTEVAPANVVRTPAPASQVASAVKTAPVRTRLAITGSDATGTVVIGTTLLAAGVGVMVIRRRKLVA